VIKKFKINVAIGKFTGYSLDINNGESTMVNHFKTEAAAKAHLVSKGFTQLKA
jgi:hypothetical protein